MAAFPGHGLANSDDELLGAPVLGLRTTTEAAERETDDLVGAPLHWDSDDNLVASHMLNFRAMIETAEWAGGTIDLPSPHHTHVSQSAIMGREEEEEEEEEEDNQMLATSLQLCLNSRVRTPVLNIRPIIEAAEWAGEKNDDIVGPYMGQPAGTGREEEMSNRMPRPQGQVHFQDKGQSRATPTSSPQVRVRRASPSHRKRKFPPILPSDQVPSEMEVTRIWQSVLLEMGHRMARCRKRCKRLKKYGLL